MDGPLRYYNETEYKRTPNEQVALKCLHNSQNITNEFLNEVKKYSINSDHILHIYGISQNPDTKDYIMIFQYANGGKLDDYISNYVVDWVWRERLEALNNIIKAPEVLKGKPYTQAADIYSFGMIMYFIMTAKQPFADCAHDSILAVKICSGIRPGINELEAPKCYIDLMKRCWDSNPDNRPNAIEIEELIGLFLKSMRTIKYNEIKKQFEKADEYRKANPSSIKRNQLTTHPQACYTSQLLNSFTKDLSKIDDVYSISVEVSDFTKGLIESE
ncbi:kinase-like domain-containing protein [Rhizophagus irregularis DAOM 181602=DAOM 197198]|nr:kinase-like domain-containing protein [Rhizophagus irregularis DAOM 181602=DAOM 197198]